MNDAEVLAHRNNMKHTFSFAFTCLILSMAITLAAAPTKPHKITNSQPQQQSVDISILQPADKQHLFHDNFKTIDKVLDIPFPVLTKLVGSSSRDKMADPGEPFQGTDVDIPSHGSYHRRLILASASPEYVFVYYEQGGFAYSKIAVLYRITNDTVKLVWQHWLDMAATPTTFNDVKSAIASQNM
jgi:hypothetical protein